MGTAHIRRKITKGRAYTECFVDDLNDFYKTGFRVHDAHRMDDFTLRLKLYCTVCDFPGLNIATCALADSGLYSVQFGPAGRPVWDAWVQPTRQCSGLLSLLVHRKEVPRP